MNWAWKTLGLTALTISLTANAEKKDGVPPPPWLMTGTHGIEVGYVLDEATVRKLLPRGVQPVKEMTGGFELYVSPGGYGLGSFSAFNVFVEVEGMDTPDGRKGRWMLLGYYGPSEDVATALREHYGYPVRAGSAHMQDLSGEWAWTGTANGKNLIEVRIRRKSNDCEMHAALEHWSGKLASGPVLTNRIPNTYCYRDVEVSGLQVLGGTEGIPVGLRLGDKPLSYAVEWENGAWSFTTPVRKP